MKSRWIVGKTVARVNQTRFWNTNLGKMDTDVTSITFTDGTILVLCVGETDDDYCIDTTAIKNGKELR